MAEDRILSTGKYRGQPPPTRADHRMTDRVHAGVQTMEAISLQSNLDRLSVDPRVEQLASCHDAVLGFGKACDHRVDVPSAAYDSLSGANAALAGRRR
ncbi:MAG TPA: hypothetical protein VH476_02700 [Solirubrobacterales bacterium]